jgi:hypothetical protein
LRSIFCLRMDTGRDFRPVLNPRTRPVYPRVFELQNSACSKTSGELRDEFADYLAALCVKTYDPMKWWWAHRREYPVLHQLALDYPSVPCEYFS